MRAAACFSIILLHELFASTVYFKDTMTAGEIKAETVFEHLLMWGVPLFLMITGSLILDPKKELTGKKLWKYIYRMLLALVCFTLIFQLTDYAMGYESDVFRGWIDHMIKGTSWAHMWYLYLMIGLYLLLPLFKGLARLNDQWILFTISVMLVFVSVVPTLTRFRCWNFMPAWEPSWDTTIPFI